MNIVQLSDLHLAGIIAQDGSYQRFMQCLKLALNYRPDFLLLTGDLVNDGNPDGYDWLFDTLKHTHLPYACIAGNHDGTVELNHHLPFDKRQFLPINFDERLMDCRRLCLGDWQLLLLNSAVPAHTHGHLLNVQLSWLKQTLSQHKNPTIIALHHHPITIQSAWIDAHMLDNAAAFWASISSHHHVQAVLCGHVHQSCTLFYQHIALHTCPATARQFAPLMDEFTIDNIAAGFRLITLKDNNYSTKIIRLPSHLTGTTFD